MHFWGFVEGRGHDGVYANGECIVKHGGDDVGQALTVYLDTWIGVDLDEPALEVLVDHDIYPKNLEVIGFPLGIDEGIGGEENISSYFFDLWENDVIESFVGIFLEHVLVELMVG